MKRDRKEESMSHVDEGSLHAYLDGELSSSERAAVDAHLGQCGECRAALAEERALLRESGAAFAALTEMRVDRGALRGGQLAVQVCVQGAFIHVRHALLLPVPLHRLLPVCGARAPVSCRWRRGPVPFASQSRRMTSPHPTTTVLRDRAA